MTKPLQPDPRRRPLDFGPCDLLGIWDLELGFFPSSSNPVKPGQANPGKSNQKTRGRATPPTCILNLSESVGLKNKQSIMNDHLPNRGDPLEPGPSIHPSEVTPSRFVPDCPGLSRFNFANHHETSSFTCPLSVQERYSQGQRTGPKTSIRQSINPIIPTPEIPSI